MQRSRIRSNTARWRLAPAFEIILGLLALVASGTALLALPWAGSAAALTLDQAAFTAVSALTTTGLSTIVPGRDLSTFGQIVLLLLMQLGGMGFMAFAVTIFRLLGRRVAFAERVALRDSLGLVDLNAIVRLTLRVLLGMLVIEAVGTLLLWLHWAEQFGTGRALYLALFHSVSAFCNASFDLFGGGGAALTNPFPADTYTLVVLALLIALGSFGIPVIADLVDWRTHPHFTLHTKLVISVWSVLTVIGTALLFLAESQGQHAFTEASPGRRLLLAFFHVVASRTSGFNVQPIDQLAPASIMTLLSLMFIGGASASTAGGITAGTFAVLVLAAGAYVRGTDTIRFGKRAISPGSVQKAVAILLVSVVVVGVGALLLMLTHPVPFDRALFEAVSAFATCGFSLGLTGQLNGFGRLIVALLMLWGRLGPLTIVLAAARSRRAAPLSYPEERVLVG
jgi:trk system potassium uptake protein TrkH